jgi:hypothetical protein
MLRSMCSERYPRVNSSFMSSSQQFISHIIDYYLMYMLKSEIYFYIILQKGLVLHADGATDCERCVEPKLGAVCMTVGS